MSTENHSGPPAATGDDDHDDPVSQRLNGPAARTPGRLRRLAAAAAASTLLVFGGSGTAQAATSSTASTQPKPASPSKGGSGAPPAGQAGPGGARGPAGGTVGTVTAIDVGSFQLKAFGGAPGGAATGSTATGKAAAGKATTVKVVETSSTSYYRGADKVKASAVKKGAFVMVTGKESDGTVSATKVTIGTSSTRGGPGGPPRNGGPGPAA